MNTITNEVFSSTMLDEIIKEAGNNTLDNISDFCDCEKFCGTEYKLFKVIENNGITTIIYKATYQDNTWDVTITINTNDKIVTVIE